MELQESRRNVDVKILSETPEETVVEVTIIEQGAPTTGPATAPTNGKAEAAKTLVEGLLKHMGVRAQVSVRQGADPITLDISGRDLGPLIGWRGETLRALQSVTNVMVGKHLAEGERVIVDVERYRQRREHTVRQTASRAARESRGGARGGYRWVAGGMWCHAEGGGGAALEGGGSGRWELNGGARGGGLGGGRAG